jgi:hypothetical protein
MPPKHSTKHVKPAFDVVRDAVEDTRTGWVYRSDTARPAQKPHAVPPPAAARFVPLPPPPVPPRSAAAPPPKPATDVAPSFGWIAGAMAMMSLPLVITAGIMIAPIALVWAARKSTNG